MTLCEVIPASFGHCLGCGTLIWIAFASYSPPISYLNRNGACLLEICVMADLDLRVCTMIDCDMYRLKGFMRTGGSSMSLRNLCLNVASTYVFLVLFSPCAVRRHFFQYYRAAKQEPSAGPSKKWQGLCSGQATAAWGVLPGGAAIDGGSDGAGGTAEAVRGKFRGGRSGAGGGERVGRDRLPATTGGSPLRCWIEHGLYLAVMQLIYYLVWSEAIEHAEESKLYMSKLARFSLR